MTRSGQKKYFLNVQQLQLCYKLTTSLRIGYTDEGCLQNLSMKPLEIVTQLMILKKWVTFIIYKILIVDRSKQVP